MSPVVEKKKREGCLGCLTHPVTLVFMALALAMVLLIVVGLYTVTIKQEQDAKLTQDTIDSDLQTLVAALQEYRAANGNYPEDLQDIVGATLKSTSLPTDPFSKQKAPYIYFPMQGGEYIIVYSVGPDGMDNQGLRDIAQCVEPATGDTGPMLSAYVQMERAKNDPDNGIGKIMRANLKATAISNLPAYNALPNRELDLVLELGWEAASEKARELNAASGAKSATDPLLNVRRLIDWNQPIADLVHEGLQYPKVEMLLDERDFSSAMPIPNYLAYQLEAKLLSCEGVLLESQGKPDEALEKYFDTIGLGRASGTTGFLIGTLIDIAIEDIAYHQIERCLIENDFDEETLANTAKRIAAWEDSATTMGDAFVSERRHLANTLDDLNSKGGAVILGGPANSWSNRGMRLYIAVNKGRILRNNERLTSELAAQMDGRNPGFEFDEAVQNSDLINRMTMPNFVNAGIRQSTLRSHAQGARVIAALMLYHKRHGDYPESLDQLTDILGKLPADPFARVPFVYERTPEGFILYSLGPDRNDDDGSPSYDPTNGAISNGDIPLGGRQ